MPSGDNNIKLEEKRSESETVDEEDYEIDEETETFTTLRRSSAFTIERFSKFF
jgi:hypothetical protein